MTEDEAKTKWCPMINMKGVGNSLTPDSINQRGPALNCIGSACMMWRSLPDSAHYSAKAETAVVDPAQGYCGLAGTP